MPRLAARTIPFLLGLLALGSFAPTAEAAELRRFSFGAGAGPTVPTGNADDALQGGMNVLGFARLNLVAFPIDPRVLFLYQSADLENGSFASDGLAGGSAYGSGQLETTSLLIEGQISIIPLGPVRLYGLAGGGWSDYHVSLEDGPGGADVDDTTSEFTFSVGLGGSVSLGPIHAFLESRYTNFENDGDLLDVNSTELLPVTLGILF